VRREEIVVLQASTASVRVEFDRPYSKAYLAWALALLVAVYTSNFIDRTILAVLQQPIKEELKLSDAQLGLLGGFAFAAFYATLGVPIARLGGKPAFLHLAPAPASPPSPAMASALFPDPISSAPFTSASSRRGWCWR